MDKKTESAKTVRPLLRTENICTSSPFDRCLQIPVHEPRLHMSSIVHVLPEDAHLTADQMGKFIELAEPSKKARTAVTAKRAAGSDTLALGEGKAGPEVSCVVKLCLGIPSVPGHAFHGLRAGLDRSPCRQAWKMWPRASGKPLRPGVTRPHSTTGYDRGHGRQRTVAVTVMPGC